MAPTTAIRKVLTVIFSGGATLAIGFLSFAGMFVLSSSLGWCITAFVLAAAYEGQVNDEGISSALRRMFGKKFLRRGIIRQYLESLLEEIDDETVITNLFLNDYREQKKYLKRLEKLSHHTEEQDLEIKRTKKQLRLMELCLLRQLEATETVKNNDDYSEAYQSGKGSQMEKAALQLLQIDRDKLLKEMQRKMWLIRISWIFAIASGVSSGLATYSAIQVGVSAFAALSIIPGGVLIAVASLAAVGYTLLLYQSISDMIQEYSGKLRTFFMKRKDESRLTHVLRCAGTILAITIAFIGTLATAGSWWYAAKNGASLLGMADQAAIIIRTVTVSLMALPSFIFGTANSVSSIDDISKSSYKSFFMSIISDIKETWNNESFFQFFNIPRLVEKIISSTAKTILFIGHIISVSLMSDGFDAVPPGISVFSNAAGEALTDMNYLPDEKKGHSNTSKILLALFVPVIIAVTLLKVFSVLWDALFTGSLSQSYNKVFSKPKVEPNPEKPKISAEWRKQQVIEVCNNIEERLASSSSQKSNQIQFQMKEENQEVKGNAFDEKEDLTQKKVNTVCHIKTLCHQGNPSTQEIKNASKSLSQNRYTMWGVEAGKPRSQCQLDEAVNYYQAASHSA